MTLLKHNNTGRFLTLTAATRVCCRELAPGGSAQGAPRALPHPRATPPLPGRRLCVQLPESLLLLLPRIHPPEGAAVHRQRRVRRRQPAHDLRVLSREWVLQRTDTHRHRHRHTQTQTQTQTHTDTHRHTQTHTHTDTQTHTHTHTHTDTDTHRHTHRHRHTHTALLFVQARICISLARRSSRSTLRAHACCIRLFTWL